MAFSETVNSLKAVFATGKTKPLAWRKQQLQALYNLLTEEEGRLAEALWQDMRKCRQEFIGSEVLLVKADIAKMLRELDNWTKPQKQSKTFVSMMDGVSTVYEPYGLALIIGAWNYPIQLTLMPLAGALAAGNCALVKPSEISTNAERLLNELLPKYLDNDSVKVVCGGPQETGELLKERFDYIFYTGNCRVARIVMQAAAQHLTPVTLELGGKSPVYVSECSNLKMAAKRICWGKFMNSGQTCIAPDYILCPPGLVDQLCTEITAVVREFYGQEPKESPDYGRMVSERMFDRVTKLIQDTKGEVVIGGQSDREQKYIAPTVVKNVPVNDALMSEELFGPVLPIIPMASPEEAVQFIAKQEKPLACYVFAAKKSMHELFLNSTSSGAIVFNDVVIHAGIENLPFGGVGNSGIGAYHGYDSFKTFSHRRSVLDKGCGAADEAINQKIRYPPYDEAKLGWLKWALSSSTKKGLGSQCAVL